MLKDVNQPIVPATKIYIGTDGLTHVEVKIKLKYEVSRLVYLTPIVEGLESVVQSDVLLIPDEEETTMVLSFMRSSLLRSNVINLKINDTAIDNKMGYIEVEFNNSTVVEEQ